MIRRISYVWSKLLKKMRLAAISNAQIHPTSKVEPGSSFTSSTMDRHSFCGYDCEISFASIGSFVSIANGVVIGGGRHPLEWVGMSPVFYEGRDSVKAKFSEHRRPPPRIVEIGNDVWIGRNAVILPGVSIGHGAVVGAGSIVTKDVEPYAIVVGNPAKLMRYRFHSDDIKLLLELAWWNLDDKHLALAAQKFNRVQDALQDMKMKRQNAPNL